ncbi:FAD-binding oxidoreductase [Pseudoruegeria sp. HB172150]|uniref:FAD-binding oxidoreductase n=1 Tax=Pseudoruegeria sp. HB172150 TaxID=2721164 RepID=UPI0015556C28|nr:FAD-linked oxidase C-terminal domain-containing protein [Pseudoruegeria sp. HB172150]
MTREELFGWCQTRFGARFGTGTSVRELHGRDESGHFPPALPDAVLWPETAQEIAELLPRCAGARCPVIPFGAGSSVEGQVLAVEGGIALDMTRMAAILDVSPGDMIAEVQAGVTREALNDHLRDTGLFFPVDPGANATLGGMASTRASGTTTIRYGTMRDAVLSVEAVLPDGSILRTGNRARKSAAGYDLTHLLVGSEGTLAVITALTLRLQPRPEISRSYQVSFPDIASAVTTVIEALQCGAQPTRIELMDTAQMAACLAESDLDLPIAPSLLIEIAGTDAAVTEEIAVLAEVARANGAVAEKPCDLPGEAAALWRMRHGAVHASRRSNPGCETLSTDLCVPISKLAEAIDRTRAWIDAAGLDAHICGHVGDGNFHAMFLCDPAQPGELQAATEIHDRMVALSLELGGTCSGEHGIGMGKKRYLRAEHPDTLPAMRAVKRALDPAGIMNPGKIFDL